jgi:hypothetical protein
MYGDYIKKGLKSKNVFVYGSLMNRSETLKVISAKTWESAVPAELANYKRLYDKWSFTRKACVLNVHPSENHSVIGLLFYSLTDDELKRIGAREVWCTHYDPVIVDLGLILTRSASFQAITSIAKQNFIQQGDISIPYQKIVEQGVIELSKRFRLQEMVRNYLKNTFDSNGNPISARYTSDLWRAHAKT